MEHWQLQDAKTRFSQVVKKSGLEWKLTKPKTTLTEFFNNSPLKNSMIDLERNKEYPREAVYPDAVDGVRVS